MRLNRTIRFGESKRTSKVEIIFPWYAKLIAYLTTASLVLFIITFILVLMAGAIWAIKYMRSVF